MQSINTDFKKPIILGLICLFCSCSSFSENYYVDAQNGSDNNSGMSLESAWKTISKVNGYSFQPGDTIFFCCNRVWRESLICQSGQVNQPVTYTNYGMGDKPIFLGSVNVCITNLWQDEGNNIWSTKNGAIYTGGKDIGNIVLIKAGETEKKAAWKRLTPGELNSQTDFYHNVNTDRLYFYSTDNPASVYSLMEAATKRNIFSINGCANVVIDGLKAAYTGAHGCVGISTENCIIRNCYFTWIGGSILSGDTRYGNGIEFWDGANGNLVENNYFEQIYDAAMTNQGSGSALVKDVIWRNNTVIKCEQAYETWFTSSSTKIQNVVFEYNECFDVGYGWSEEQRPNKNATFLLSYAMNAGVFDLNVRYNTFNNTIGDMILFVNSRLPEVTIDHNTYIREVENCTAVRMFYWGGTGRVAWNQYRSLTGNDTNSTFSCEDISDVLEPGDIPKTFRIYPNPTDDKITIEIFDFNPVIPVLVSVANSTGIEIIKDTINSGKTSYLLKENGIYYVTVKKGANQTTVKVVKRN